MFINGPLFWFLMGVVFLGVGAGFRAFAADRGWVLTWWKGLLALVWYAIFALTVFAFGTLVGENEAAAGLRFLAFGLFLCLVLGIVLWRLMGHTPAVDRRASSPGTPGGPAGP